ncbi:glycoside hydrolase family 2 protein [Desertivirga arenae]|uniref:glycoside hydrolase family 2 protein n=1 Tax=Desertivirga arenae TaxID=2810309 RepID=UPI001A969503|nr:glycoside hydrolase family 2 TIM barrel-domain containing protein [Pedobacter sp. SYSU D00823]
MIKELTLSCILGLVLSITVQGQNWKAIDGRIKTQWGEALNAKKPLPEYPRPQFVRQGNWLNLNGLWDYGITPVRQGSFRKEGKILVPFAVESALSGVGRNVGKDNVLWYNTSFSLPAGMRGKKVLLHFGGSDWRTTVSLNGKMVGEHEGGNDPFSFDISKYLKGSGSQTLTVKVWDPTDEGPQPRGKQVRKPGSIWYTPVTGIWQTVWLEAVNPSYVEKIRITPDIDAGSVTIQPSVSQKGSLVRVSAWDGTTKIAEQEIAANGQAVLPIKNAKLWAPGSPFLYDLQVELLEEGKVVDQVKSYFAMRKVSLGKDANGIQRILLNNKFVFQYGPLDQGWWPDGLYTAPTTEALRFDIEKTKEMGFNMIRKHIKVEPAIWYYFCDKAGMLVWQDMPSGDNGENGWENRLGVLDKQSDRKRTPESEAIYKKEWNAIMESLHNYPSIVVWTPFNESWGQFKTAEIVDWTKKKDPSRLVNAASGGNFVPAGDIIDIHNYPHPAMPDPAFYGDKRALVLGEFGGLGLPVKNHLWKPADNWGYQTFKNEEEMFGKYSEFIARLKELIEAGLSAAVYTQTTDVEVETNGLMTYDRKVIKFPVSKMMDLHKGLYTK